jgi:kinesin family protein 11
MIGRSHLPADALKPPNTSIMRTQRSPSAHSVAGSKRKERDFEPTTGEDTNIHVVVRCRGRNDREIKENSGVVVVTEGVKGKSVELSMGPNALSNKTYHFDKVFSPAADQATIYDDVVTPILNEVNWHLTLLYLGAVSLIVP